MGTRLHEILAVEGIKDGYFKSTIPEMINCFKNKANLFQGFERTLKLNGEDTVDKSSREDAEKEQQAINTTVQKELVYMQESIGDYFDIMLQRDEANQRAVADVIIDGVVIASNVPATTLLALENKLKQLRPVYEQIPTLQPGVTWDADDSYGDNIFKDRNPEIRAKTKKGFDFKVLTAATDKHAAQIEKWETVDDVGFFTKIRWSSMISVSEKSKLLTRFDKLNMAIKQARQRANEVEIASVTIGSNLFNFLHTS